MQGRGIVNVRPGEVELWDLDLPEPGPDDVVVETRYSMISPGTERSVLMGERSYGRAPGHPADLPPFPQVGGYQKVGVVVQVGKNVREFAEGDWVFCMVGQSGMAEFQRGGHVSPSIQSADQVLKLPPDVDPVLFSGLVLTQVGYNHASRPPIEDGTKVLVLGDGLVGQWLAESIQLRGAQVLLAGHHDERLACCRLQAGSEAVNTTREDLEERAEAFCPDGFPVVADTLTSADAIHFAAGFLRHNGHLVAGGYYIEGQNLINYQTLCSREATLYTPGGWQRQRLEETLALVASGQLDVEGKITHHFPVAENCWRAFELLVDRSEHFLGIVMDWEEE